MKRFELVPALDVADLDEALRLVERTAPIDFVYGYKVGFSLGLLHGLGNVVSRIRQITPKPVIYDHQKAGTDIPDTGRLFARVMKESGVSEVILFPQAGPATLEAWVAALQDEGLHPVIGALMTHPAYLVSEGGFLADEAIVRIFARSWELGVRAFVTPLTKPERTHRLLTEAGIGPGAVFYSPGLGAQGGDPMAFPFLGRHRLIAGRALLRAPDPEAWVGALHENLVSLGGTP